jgi:hypothetical protein
MHPAITLIAENAVNHHHLVLPSLLVILGAVAAANNPPEHSLFVTAASWALIWIPAVFRAGLWGSSSSRSRKTTSWLAGGFLALAHICDRAACDLEGTLATKVGMGTQLI